MLVKETIEDEKERIRSRRSKDRQYNGQKKLERTKHNLTGFFL